MLVKRKYGRMLVMLFEVAASMMYPFVACMILSSLI